MCHDTYLVCYDLITGTETCLRDTPVGMYSPCVAVVDNFLYVCGGKYDSTDNNEIATARCHRYDPRFDVWFELMSMNEARKDFAMAAFDGHLYAIAGQDENVVMYTAERFSITENEWTSVSPLPSGALYCHQVSDEPASDFQLIVKKFKEGSRIFQVLGMTTFIALTLLTLLVLSQEGHLTVKNLAAAIAKGFLMASVKGANISNDKYRRIS